MITESRTDQRGERPHRIVIVDRDEIVRYGLKSVLEQHEELSVVSDVGSGEEALERVTEAAPDLLVLEPATAATFSDALDLVKRVGDIAPELRTVLFTRSLDEQQVLSAVRAGVSAIILKDTSTADLVRLVLDVARGGWALDPSSLAALMHAVRSEAPGESLLTGREREVLELVVTGKTNRTIASTLFITEATVKFHLRNIMDKLNVRRRTEVVSVALRWGLVSMRADPRGAEHATEQMRAALMALS